MEVVLKVDNKAGAFAQGVAKFVADVKKATGPGAGSAGVITAEVLSAAVSDLIPAFADFGETVSAIKAEKVKFALAFANLLDAALEG